MTDDIFEVLLLIGRPASGKSEIIDFLTRTPVEERRRFHIGEMDVLDDFPMLWTWFEEDDLLQGKFGLPRLHSTEQGYFKYKELWHVLIERLCLDYGKILRDRPDYHATSTALIEFSRGSEHGGYRAAFAHLSPQVLQRAAILYVSVSFAESLRKNRKRFNPARPDSLLEHGLSDTKMHSLYQHDDWRELAPAGSGYISLAGGRIPYAVFENEDDVTTGKPDLLSARLAETLDRLWGFYRSR
jgi:hypothetical protein